LHSAKALLSAALGKEFVGKEFFVECHVSGMPSATSALGKANDLTASLPSADVASTQQRFNFFKKKYALPSADVAGTRQSFFVFF
jgi:hypothetical protein